jgi:hypothetical protein
MRMKVQGAIYSRETAGDAAVSGLLSGILAGIVMAAFLVAAGFMSGDTVATVLSRFGAGQGTTPLVGLLTHLAVSGVYGLLWGVLARLLLGRVPAPGWMLGLGYGLLLFLIAQGLFLVGPTPLTGVPPLHFLLAHAVFGLVLGLQSRWRGGE